MRKIVFGAASSLDNFIARPDHSVDWLMWCDEAAEVTAGHWKRFDAVLMGRKTYEVAARKGGGKASSGIQSYIVSRTIKDSPKGVTVIDDDVGKAVRALKTHEGKDICLLGGGELARSLFEEGLIDEVGFNIHPLLLGKGVPLFNPMRRQISLELKECRPFRNGCVHITYDVKHAG